MHTGSQCRRMSWPMGASRSTRHRSSLSSLVSMWQSRAGYTAAGQFHDSAPGSVKTIAIGVAGLGRAFGLMAPTLVADPRVRVVAAADPRAQARQQFES